MRRLLLVFVSALLASPAAGAVLGTEAGCYWHANGDLPVDWQDGLLIVTDKTLTFTEVECARRQRSTARPCRPTALKPGRRMRRSA